MISYRPCHSLALSIIGILNAKLNSIRCHRYVPSQADVTVFDALGGTCPEAGKFPHAHRWFKHIKSYNSGEKSKFPGVKKPLDSFPGLTGGSGDAGSKADQDEDDIDLFGSDDEEVGTFYKYVGLLGCLLQKRCLNLLLCNGAFRIFIWNAPRSRYFKSRGVLGK